MRRKTRNPAGRVSGGTRDFATIANQTIDVYASSTGSDTAGDGTLANPYASVSRAMRDCPSVWRGTLGSNAYFRVLWIGGAIPLFDVRVAPRIEGVRAFVQLLNWGDGNTATFGTTTDTRITHYASKTNLTPTAASQYATNRPRYTLPASTIGSDDQYFGEVAQIFDSGGTVLARGRIVKTVASTQDIIIEVGSLFTASTSHRIYIGKMAAELSAGVSRIVGVNVEPTLGLIRCPGATATLIVDSNVAVWMVGCECVGSSASGLNVGPSTGPVTLGRASSVHGTTQTALGYPANEASVGRVGTSAVRTAGGANLASGILVVSQGALVGGDWTPGQGGLSLQINNNSTWRGSLQPSTSFAVPCLVRILGSDTNPTLWMRLAPSSNDAMLAVIYGLQVVLGTSGDTATIAVNNEGDSDPVVLVKGGAVQGLLKINKADAGGAALAGLVVDVVRDGVCGVAAASDQAGTGGDVRAGGNSPLTYAALAALTPARDTDALQMASVRAA